jgi:MoxR-like ATPase
MKELLDRILRRDSNLKLPYSILALSRSSNLFFPGVSLTCVKQGYLLHCRCTEIPGKFEWEPGLLTRALQQGAWLLIEDIDTAQQDVLALLSSLLQSGEPTHTINQSSTLFWPVLLPALAQERL